jgi:hypothetical protein
MGRPAHHILRDQAGEGAQALDQLLDHLQHGLG